MASDDQTKHEDDEALPPPPRRTPDRPMRWGRKLMLIGMLPGCYYLAQYASQHPDLVESYYSTLIFPWVAGILSALSSPFAFSMGELVAGAILLYLGLRFLLGTFRVLRGTRGIFETLMRGIVDTAAFAGLIAFLFTALWGLNYYRQPFAETAQLAEEMEPAPSPQELRELCEFLIERAELLRLDALQEATKEDTPSAELGFVLADGIEGARDRSEIGFRELPHRYETLAGEYGPPKPIHSSSLFSYLGIAGIYSPFTGEPNINPTIPECAVPFVMCHEMAHQRGYAREDEANFIGYLACSHHTDSDFQYSGHLMALSYALGALSQADPKALNELVGFTIVPVESEQVAELETEDGPVSVGVRVPSKASASSNISRGLRTDLDAFGAWAREWTLRFDWLPDDEFVDEHGRPIGIVRHVARKANDVFLKANGQEDGVESYDRMVRLLIAERRKQAKPAAKR